MVFCGVAGIALIIFALCTREKPSPFPHPEIQQQRVAAAAANASGKLADAAHLVLLIPRGCAHKFDAVHPLPSRIQAAQHAEGIKMHLFFITGVRAWKLHNCPFTKDPATRVARKWSW